MTGTFAPSSSPGIQRGMNRTIRMASASQTLSKPLAMCGYRMNPSASTMKLTMVRPETQLKIAVRGEVQAFVYVSLHGEEALFPSDRELWHLLYHQGTVQLEGVNPSACFRIGDGCPAERVDVYRLDAEVR